MNTNPLRAEDDWYPAGLPTDIEYAPTNDPRVLAVIERDTTAMIHELFDGDAIPPMFQVEGHRNGRSERRRITHIGGYSIDEEIVDRIFEADEMFLYAAGYRHDGLSISMIVKADEMHKRWARIFYGIWFEITDEPDRKHITLSTPEFREHVGALRRPRPQEVVLTASEELVEALHGVVYGVGWAINHDRTDEDAEIDLTDDEWDVEIVSWGYIGEGYAKREAALFDDPPVLEPLPEGAGKGDPDERAAEFQSEQSSGDDVLGHIV